MECGSGTGACDFGILACDTGTADCGVGAERGEGGESSSSSSKNACALPRRRDGRMSLHEMASSSMAEPESCDRDMKSTEAEAEVCI